MNLSSFIAKRIFDGGLSKSRVSAPAVTIATWGIAIGLMVMLLAVCIVTGFKNEVKNQITGFGAQIELSNFDAVTSYEKKPIYVSDSLIVELKQDYPSITHVQRTAIKPGMLKTDQAFSGIVLKGIGPDYDSHFFTQHLVKGEMPTFSNKESTGRVVISQSISQEMGLDVGDKMYVYFISDKVKARRFKVCGIYQTHFVEYDKVFVLVDMYTIQRLQKWDSNQVTTLEISLQPETDLESTTYALARRLTAKSDGHGEQYYVQNTRQLHEQIFAWLDLLDMNVVIILVLMFGVAMIIMVSGLLIIILERTQMIGLLKALGSANHQIRHTFLWLAFLMIGKGLLWGNILAAIFFVIQYYGHVIPLNPAVYYVDSVPLQFNLWYWIGINVITLCLSLFVMLLPTYIISRIHPSESMRYE